MKYYSERPKGYPSIEVPKAGGYEKTAIFDQYLTVP